MAGIKEDAFGIVVEPDVADGIGALSAQKTSEYAHGSFTHAGTAPTAATSTTSDEATTTISPGATLTGVINTAGDTDYYNISLVAGQTYSISLAGSGTSALVDPMLTLFNSGGIWVANDDDGGRGIDSLLTFTATVTGTYQITAAAYPDSGLTGGYTLAVRQMGTDLVGSTRGSATAVATEATTYGFVETSGDVDMYAVTLVEGLYYSFNLAGGVDYASSSPPPAGELDTRITIYNAAGTQIASNNDLSAEDLSSGTGFIAQASGTYYVSVAAGVNQTGGYTLQVEGIDLSTQDPLDSIDWGTRLPSTTVTVYFARAGETFDGIKSLGWSDYEIKQAMAALNAYAEVSGLTFTRTTSSSGASFRLVTTQSDEYLGYFNPPGTTGAGIGVFATNGTGWNTTGGLEPGGIGFATLIHEFGHGLGLAHPHDNGGTSSIMVGVSSSFESYGVFDLNQGVYTTMSYNDGWQLSPGGTSSSLNYGYQAGPSAFDIALIQQKYGTSANNSGNNVYSLRSLNAAGTFYDVIWDTGGRDTIRYSGSLSARIDLTSATLDYSATGAGVISYVNGVHGGFTIAAGVVIENAKGGSGADVLIGNTVNNVLNGGLGADTMQGRRGHDTYYVENTGDKVVEIAGEGTDRVISSISYTLTAGVENLILTGSAGLSGTGNALRNIITGNSGANTLSGGGGNDTLNGRLGADTMAGGAGHDIYVVDNSGDRVTEAVGEGTDLVYSKVSFTLGANVERLTLTGTAAVSGTGNDLANLITGNGAANTLYGQGGADILSGRGGADHLYGGAGNDRLIGGAGSDSFYFNTALNSRSNVDRVIDFSAADDSLYLDDAVFNGLSVGTLAAGALRFGTAAADADDRIIYDSATGKLYYDADGSGSGAAVLFGQLAAGTALSNVDFIIY